jgi:hypothetical protein
LPLHCDQDRRGSFLALFDPASESIDLDDLNRMLERRGHRFVRYATTSRSTSPPNGAAERVMGCTGEFIERRLKLRG